MTIKSLVSEIRKKQSFLCIGLDSDIDKIPPHLLSKEDPVFAFNKAIIDATHDLCVAYKPNTAFYEALGSKGWESLKKTISYIRTRHPGIMTLVDAKRGDIGNTATQYARAFFGELGCDALTVAPYMGRDSVEPFLEFENKFVVLLALTSNHGATDFQFSRIGQEPLFREVIKKALTYKNAERLMFVVGATKAEYLKDIREIIPDHFLLVPGVGAQGGSLEEVCTYGMTKNVGLLINSSRGIIFASNRPYFADSARIKAKELQGQMAGILAKKE